MCGLYFLSKRKFSLVRKLKNLILILELIKDDSYCWINALNIKRVSSISFELAEKFGLFVSGNLILALIKFYGVAPNAYLDEETKHVVRFNYKISTEEFEEFYHLQNNWSAEECLLNTLNMEEEYGSNVDIGRTIHYSVTNIAQTGTIGNESASGALAEYSKRYIKGALICPYACNNEQQEAIRRAFDNRLVMFDFPGKEVSHPHLKFLADHMNNSLLNLDYTNRKVKVLGPKFNNYEVEAIKTAETVHFCTKMPAKTDINRSIDSKKQLDKTARILNIQKEELANMIENLKKEQLKKAGSPYVVEIKENIMKLATEKGEILDELEHLDKEREAITSTEHYSDKRVCNVGAEACKEKCDVALSLHSLYDINLRKLLRNQGELGMEELYCTVILPFGLLFVDSYYSDELQVQFRKDGNGFMMIHGRDLSNGYAHPEATQIMELMNNSFISTSDGNWSYEIVDSKGEMCKLRFTRANEGQRIVRKLLPPKFDNYTIIMDPLDYFGRRTIRTPILIQKDKFDAAIKSVTRAKNTKEIIENTFAFVQASFMKVVVGNTELQSGGTLSTDVESAIVLAAVIEGGIRKHLVGDAYRRCLNSNGFLNKVWKEISEVFEKVLNAISLGLYDYMQPYAAEKYIKERVNLADLILDTSCDRLNRITKHISTFSEKIGETCDEYWSRMPTLYEYVFKNDDDMLKEAFGDDTLGMWMKSVWCIDKGGKYKALKSKKQEEEITSKQKDKILKYEKMYKYIDAKEALRNLQEDQENIKMPEALKEEIIKGLDDLKTEIDEDLSLGSSSSSASSTVIEEIEETIDNLKFEAHDPESVIHINGNMDDLTLAALAHNKKRALEIKADVKIEGKVLDAQVKRLTKFGKTCHTTASLEFIESEVEKLKHMYAVDSGLCSEEVLKKLKEKVLGAVKKVQEDGSLETIARKNLEIIQGYSGSGKTFHILKSFDVGQDSYISPLAAILDKFRADLKKHKPGDMKMTKRKNMTKTFEKFMEIKKDGGTLYIDECSKFHVGFLLTIIAYTKYEKYVLVGDPEQTGSFDPTGEMTNMNYTELVEKKNLTTFYFTFRFGPTGAAFLNSTFNYPIFSLKNKDTRISYNDVNDFNSSVKGTNITITTKTKDYLKDDLGVSNVMTANASQGLTVPIVNLYLRTSDINSAISFRSNGIVAASRMEDELNIYYNLTSAKHRVSSLEWLRENYATVFDIVLPTKVDF